MFKFFGSKYKLGPVYPPPQTKVIIEPFAGAAAYAVLHRHVAERVVLIEKDERVVDLWHRLLRMTSQDVLDIPEPEAGQRSDDLLVAFAAGRTTRDTPESFIVSPRMAQRFRPMMNRVASVVDECRHFEVLHGDYTDAPDIEATWFIDPPYQAPPQGGRWDRTRGGRYLHPNRDLDYAAMAEWTLARQGQVIACDQDGSTWLPWTDRQHARDNTHAVYGEVWYHRDLDD